MNKLFLMCPRRFMPLVMVALSLLLATGAFSESNPKIDHQANLAKVPATDPQPQKDLTIIKKMMGQHPRLLFTKKEIEELKVQLAKDPILKKTLTDVINTVNLFPVTNRRPDIVTDETAAIWKSGGTYPGLAYAYHLGKSEKAKNKILGILSTMLEESYWNDHSEVDSSMGASNNMLMVGVLFDALASELPAELRAKLSAKILVHIRRMWYLGHQQLSVGTVKYWQQDPQNNHRWHRNVGMAACLLAIADEPGLDTGYMLEQFKAEMDFIIKWLPHDGDCHEGAGYQVFGFMRLALTVRMMDRVLGTHYQQSPGFHNAWAQQLYWWAPGRGGNMSFGDDVNGDGGGFGYDDAGFFIGPQLSRDKVAQAALTFRMQAMHKKKPGDLPWTLFVFYDPTLTGGDEQKLPTRRLLVDLGAASMRDTWKPDAVAFSFKCGPYGGAKLNEFSWSTGQWTYINVAHDDPDANSFALGMDGDLVFHPGAYSMPKWTESNSTILIDGKGQVKEGDTYTQPVNKTDMRTLSYLTGWNEGQNGRTIVEGETGKAYQGSLQRFRRSAVFLRGEYILLLDDIVATKKSSITWLGITPQAKLVDEAMGRLTATGKGGKTVALQMVADAPFETQIKPLKVAARWGDLDVEQIRFTAEAEFVHFACVLDPWGQHPEIATKKEGVVTTVTVTMNGTVDTWTWRGAVDDNTPSSIEGKRRGRTLISLDESNRVFPEN